MASMNDRGQMLLIGAIVMAVSFVALGIVLNGSFHTATMASQATDEVTDGNIEVIERTVTSDFEAMTRRIVAEHPDLPDQENRMDTYVSDFADMSDRYFATQDAVVSVSTTGTRAQLPGSHIEHSGGEFLTPGTSTHTIINGGRARDFEMRSLSFSGTGPFIIIITDDNSDEYRVEIENEPAGPEVNVVRPGGSVETCTVGATSIDITERMVGGQHCTALSRLSDVEAPYTIEFENGDQIEGEYELVGFDGVSTPGPATSDGELYGVEFDLVVNGIDSSVEQRIVAAPGEIHD